MIGFRLGVPRYNLGTDTAVRPVLKPGEHNHPLLTLRDVTEYTARYTPSLDRPYRRLMPLFEYVVYRKSITMARTLRQNQVVCNQSILCFNRCLRLSIIAVSKIYSWLRFSGSSRDLVSLTAPRVAILHTQGRRPGRSNSHFPTARGISSRGIATALFRRYSILRHLTIWILPKRVLALHFGQRSLRAEMGVRVSTSMMKF